MMRSLPLATHHAVKGAAPLDAVKGAAPLGRLANSPRDIYGTRMDTNRIRSFHGTGRDADDRARG